LSLDVRCTLMRKPVLKLSIALVFSTLALMACDAVDSLKSGLEHSQAVSAELEKSIGSKPLVGFNWSNGFLTSVTVTFDGVPKDKSLVEISEASRSAVLKEFKQEPKQIVVSFAITP